MKLSQIPFLSLKGIVYLTRHFQFLKIWSGLDPDAGKEWGQEGRIGWQRMRQLDGITDSMESSVNKLQRQWWTGKPGVLQSTGSQRVGHDLGSEEPIKTLFPDKM